jgi:hypothetical protein
MTPDLPVDRTREDLPSSMLSLDPGRIAFWSGSGISVDAPTQGPIGDELTNRALKEAFTSELLDKLLMAYSSLGLDRKGPRLESVLEVAVREHGLPILLELMADLAVAPPNESHGFFARHTAAGGGHVTANFDECIERAGGVESRIVHCHGRLTTDDGGESLGARLSLLERGFDHAHKGRLDEVIVGRDAMVVVGYGGIDHFDVDPYWRSLSEEGAMEGKAVLWIEHQSSGWNLLRGKQCTVAQLSSFRAGGAEVAQVQAPTRAVLVVLANAWGLTPPGPPPPREHRAVPTLGLDLAQRSGATLRFFSFAGMHKEVGQLLPSAGLGADEHLWAAQAAWAAGRYRLADWHWSMASRDDAAGRAFRAERAAAVMWLRGQLLGAYRHLKGAIATADAEVGIDPEQRLVMAETLGRILVHMHRLPDVRAFATRSRRRHVLALLDSAQADAGRALPTELRARVGSVRADLGAPNGGNNDFDPVADFEQSDALGWMMNYVHGELRKQASNGRTSSAHELREHAGRFEALGDFADAARVPLPPGAGPAFSPKETWRGFSQMDFTRWHRARLFCSWYALRCATTLRSWLRSNPKR